MNDGEDSAMEEATMTARTITVTIPEMLYLQIEAVAHSSVQTMDAVVVQTLERTIPPQLAALLPVPLHAEINAMEHLSDEALLAIAYSVAPRERGEQMDTLIASKQAGGLAADAQEQLMRLRNESEALMVRKAHAFALLKSRGHTLPKLDQLPVPVG